jgi:hypothetical protein
MSTKVLIEWATIASDKDLYRVDNYNPVDKYNPADNYSKSQEDSLEDSTIKQSESRYSRHQL